MKEFIRNLLVKQIAIGSLSVKVSTIAATVAAVLAVGGTASAVVIHATTPKENDVVQVADLGQPIESQPTETEEQSTGGSEKDANTTGTTEESKDIENAHIHTFSSKVLTEST